MEKSELEKRVVELEKKVADLEAQKVIIYQPVYFPYYQPQPFNPWQPFGPVFCSSGHQQ